MQPRRSQKPITIRSDRAAARLAILTRDGSSQADIIEKALDRVPEPRHPVDGEARWARIREIQEQAQRELIPSMAEFDAIEYDADGSCR